MIRRPVGVHGVFCNRVEVFDGADYVTNGRGPGQVLDDLHPRAHSAGPKGRAPHLIRGVRPRMSAPVPGCMLDGEAAGSTPGRVRRIESP